MRFALRLLDALEGGVDRLACGRRILAREDDDRLDVEMHCGARGRAQRIGRQMCGSDAVDLASDAVAPILGRRKDGLGADDRDAKTGSG